MPSAPAMRSVSRRWLVACAEPPIAGRGQCQWRLFVSLWARFVIMARRREQAAVMRVIQAAQRNSVARARSSARGRRSNRRGHFVMRTERLPFAPPEDWYEPVEGDRAGYRIVVQPPG